MAKKTFIMEKPNDPKKEFTFSNRVDEKQFVLLSRGVHWIDEDAGLVMDEECVCDRVKRAGGTLR